MSENQDNKQPTIRPPEVPIPKDYLGNIMQLLEEGTMKELYSGIVFYKPEFLDGSQPLEIEGTKYTVKGMLIGEFEDDLEKLITGPSMTLIVKKVEDEGNIQEK